jgi:23S rRNA (uracil1939-C5)-methyltransferase
LDDLIEVDVRGIAAGGSGVADLPDGRVVFVPRTAPGDRVRIRIVKSRPRWAEGRLEQLDEPSVERRAPLCTLYSECGGCQLQHLPYAEQLRWKGQIVADALTRIGGLGDVAPPEVIPSPKEIGYRNRVSFTLRRLHGGRVVAGFHALDRPSKVIDVAGQCVLPEPRLRDVWKALRGGWGPGARLLPGGGRLRLTLRQTSEGVALVVEGGDGSWSAADLGAAVPQLTAIWHRPARAQGGPRLLEGVFDEGGPAFAQVNTEVASAMRAHVLEMAGTGERAIDAYGGVGVYGRSLAERGWTVTGLERDPAACEEAARGAPVGFSVVQGSVEAGLAGALPADLVILNPPRTGLHADVVRIISAGRVPRIVYVSCDPATLARDVAGLTARYRVGEVRCFDLFPQTAHVETVLVLTATEEAT